MTAEQKLAEVERVLTEKLILGHSHYAPKSKNPIFMDGYNQGREDHKSYSDDVAHFALGIIRGE
ncbi:MAG TPA: hypothetical protein VN577_20005 [Terriglobales bacterium]|nr:hypothetical protein [Terriglobales bacterium]